MPYFILEDVLFGDFWRSIDIVLATQQHRKQCRSRISRTEDRQFIPFVYVCFLVVNEVLYSAFFTLYTKVKEK